MNHSSTESLENICAGERVVSNLARFVMIIWFFVVLILTQSYTAGLTSRLTVQQLQPTVTSIDELLKKGENVGYQRGSFVLGILKRLGFNESKLIPYDSPEHCNALFSNGTAKNGIVAAFDEVPYMKVFLGKFCNKYTMIDPTFKIDGWGFVSSFYFKHTPNSLFFLNSPIVLVKLKATLHTHYRFSQDGHL